jgi:WD40 repeat protein
VLGHKDFVKIVLSGNFLFSGSGDSFAKQWDKTTGELIRNFEIVVGEAIMSLAVSEDGQFLYTGTTGGTGFVSYLIQWRISDGSQLKAFQGSAASS